MKSVDSAALFHDNNFSIKNVFFKNTLCQPSFVDILEAHVPNKLKKIWKGQFINLSILLKSAAELENFNSHCNLQIKNDCLCITTEKQTPFLPIEK